VPSSATVSVWSSRAAGEGPVETTLAHDPVGTSVAGGSDAASLGAFVAAVGAADAEWPGLPVVGRPDGPLSEAPLHPATMSIAAGTSATVRTIARIGYAIPASAPSRSVSRTFSL
jgi:hypothetical protein